MGEGNSLINLGDSSKPATVLIEKISEAVGGYFRPHQIKRVAEAEKIKAKADLEISKLEQRAVQRFIAEEAQKQANIEIISSKAIPNLDEDSDPSKVENDWIVNFFDKCRLISDDEMQDLWAKVLAGEANNPKNYSKRTINFLSSLDKQDALLFEKLCGFNWNINGLTPIILNEQDEIYKDNGISFSNLLHLNDIGLVSLEPRGYDSSGHDKRIKIKYYDKPVNIEFPDESENKLRFGKILLTKVGEELAPICESNPVKGFLEYVFEEWEEDGLSIS